MNKEELLSYLRNPAGIPPERSDDLEKLVRIYPWFQAGRILLARALAQGGDLRYGEALKDAAVHAGNRAHLKEQLEAKVRAARKEEPREEPQPVQAVPIEPDPLALEMHLHDELIAYPEIAPLPEPLEPEASPNPQSVPPSTGRHSFTDWLRQMKNNEATKSTGETPHNVEHPEKKEALIDEFIRTEPRISTPRKAEFFSPVNMARKSIEDKQEIVTETLARIYANQGNKEKAIQIYRKLSLREPAKSSYFAALIDKLEKS